jgi:gamma-tubulin complex component 5
LDWDSRWSTPSLSPLNSGDLALDEESDEEVEEQLDVAALPVAQQDGPSYYAPLFDSKGANAHPPYTYAHRREFEALQEKQYWRDGWKGDGTLVKTVFNMGDASSLGDQSICLVFC